MGSGSQLLSDIQAFFLSAHKSLCPCQLTGLTPVNMGAVCFVSPTVKVHTSYSLCALYSRGKQNELTPLQQGELVLFSPTVYAVF